MPKSFLWEALVFSGLLADRKTASAWIMSGKVFVDGRRVDKPGYEVAKGAAILIKDVKKYVSKGGLKLEGALRDFALDVTGKVALDTGASTGGFTDCLLRHGAKRVYAIDVGFGQLAGTLRADDRVVNMEKTNIGEVDPQQLQPRPEIASIDLSYLSLKKAIPIVALLLDESSGQMVCLVKPLFEVADSAARRSGSIENPQLYKDVLLDLVDYVTDSGLSVLGVTHSHVTGNSGTREFFLRVSLRSGSGQDWTTAVDQAIDAALQLPQYDEENQVTVIVGENSPKG